MHYPGGKVRLSKYIAPILMKYRENRTYLEPFVGGCGMMRAIRGGTRIGSDVNESLIMLWKAMQEGVFSPPVFVSKDTYDRLKIEREPSALQAFVGIESCHMGVWFGGFHTVNFNKGKGKAKPYASRKTFQETCMLVCDVDFHHCSYNAWNDLDDCFVYCDPPYAGTSTNCYRDKSFDHADFWKWCDETAKRNRVVVSEMSAPENWKSIWSLERAWNGNFKHKALVRKTEHLFVHESAEAWL